jgi:Bacterial Ig domain/Abnormal spindle-like microcephaly-assoc'd, ASPM-SPD-2-Hydin
MRFIYLKTSLKKAVLVASVLLLGVGLTVAQQQVNLTAGPTTLTLPDGSTVPMWGYTCAGPSAITSSTATCALLNKGAATAGTWSPVVITVPTGATGGLQINLTNNLSFTPPGAATANTVPTSLMIVGLVGGGLGTPTAIPSPAHISQPITWPTANAGGEFTPPVQKPRVQSFGTEVLTGSTTALNWPVLRPGTYLLESGTHPSIQVPMGLYGILVVTTAPTPAVSGGAAATAGTAYPGVTYDADVPLEFSEIDPVQNYAVSTAINTAGFVESAARDLYLQPGPVVSTLVFNGGSGYSTTTPPNVSFQAAPAGGTTAIGTANVNSSGQVTSITLTSGGSGYTSDPIVTIGTPGAGGTQALAEASLALGANSLAHCSGGVPACYPAAVNFTPLYYLINGVAFSKISPAASQFLASIPNAPPTGTATGKLLVRLVNAGSHMHMPSIVRSVTGTALAPGFSIIAEDGNPVPGIPKVQSDVFMSAGKTYDVLVNGPAGGVTAVNIKSAGVAYTSGVSVVNIASGALTGCASPVTVTLTPVDLNGSGATATATLDSTGTVVTGIVVNTPGTGYTSAPAVSVTDANATCSSTTAATAVLAPLPVNFSGGGGSGAAATATINGGVVTSITVSNSGSGYTSFPVVSITGSPTTAAVLAAVIDPGAGTLPVYDRELSLSGNSTERDAGMLAYISTNGGMLPAGGAGALFAPPVANPDTYNSVLPCTTAPCQALTVLDPSKGVIANDVNVYGVKVSTAPTQGTLALSTNGTFSYLPNAGWSAPDSFTYCGNGTTSGAACTTVTLGLATVEASSGITCSATTYNASIATYLAIKTPGVLAGCKDAAGYPLTATAFTAIGYTVVGDANGGFTAAVPGAGVYTFTFQAKNSQGTLGAITTATLNFPTGSGLKVTVLDGKDKTTTISDYRWIIEEDRTFYINPGCTQNPPPAGCPTATAGIVPTLGTNFHTSYMPYVAQGCTGPQSCEGGQTVLGQPSVCDVGNGLCRPDTTGNGFTQVTPDQVALDPTKHYYISVLPGDSANPFYAASANGHGMGGGPISCTPVPPATTCTFPTAVTVLTQPSPYPPSKLSVFVFEDDFPLNGEQDGGGGIDVLSPNEPGLGQFQIHLWDAMGGNGDFTGQMSYDMFNQPLSNSLAGAIDPVTQQDACPISVNSRNASDPTSTGITGMIVTCPKYEADGKTLSPLAGQAVIANLMPGRFGVIATPGADRIAKGEEWLQTNTLDGQKAHDSFVRIGEPSFFQEFGPAGYHVSIGFANPKIINSRLAGVCNGTDPNITGTCAPGNTLKGTITGQRLSRTPDERLYSSGSHDTFYWTQCFVSVGDQDGEDFAFTKCDANGNFQLTGLPDGDWRVTTFDQWNDQLVDGLSTPVRLGGGTTGAEFCPGAGSSKNVCNMGDIASTQWQTNLYTRTFIDDNRDGIAQGAETGIPFANVAVRLRDGSLENLLLTDFGGTANFNETFPLFSWYTVETDTTRYKNTGTHVVYDVGGPADGSAACGVAGYPPCGTSVIAKNLANSAEQVSVPASLRIPGAVYCGLTAGADCTGKSIQNGPSTSDLSNCTIGSTGTVTCGAPSLSSGRIDPPWIGVEGWQGFPGQNSFLEFGKEPYATGENGGIKGHVIYASTRPFDDPQMLVQTQWEPLVPHVTINLYQEGFASDGITPILTLVDHTQTSSFDDWAQGFHLAADGVTKIPNMSCPGQSTADLFYFSLSNQPNYLDFYNSQHGGGAYTPLPGNAQFKCYDGMHDWNQLQPAPYDGMYQFPSVTSVDPTTGKPNATNCAICSPNHAADSTDLYYGIPMLPSGKYVVEVVVPPGFELVKEEDKNILIGDNFIAPVTQQFGGLGNIFILPDQAQVGSAYNANNAQNPTQSFGTSPSNGIVPSFVPEPTWPCVGEARIVPDYISLYPQSKQVAPFAGATRNLCDRKEVTLNDQMGAIAKFFVYTSTHIASKFTGGITDDYTSEFDPFSPQFGEKFAPPDLPVSVKDWTGNEISRVYADHWGAYDGMTYSTWEVNPPNPTGYSPTMMVFCMNDPGPIPGPGGTMIKDPQFTEGYSQFCYELPFMPGTTQYLDTPVVPTSAFAGAGYNNVDCSYPDTTPAISEVDGDGVGPWVSQAGNTLTITALGDQTVPNYAYSGPSATTNPFNKKTITRHYGFGSQCTSVAGVCTAISSVTIGGVAATVTSWNDTSISVTVPNGVANCGIQQQALYAPGATSTQCGQLTITAGNGKQSIDTVTVTIGGKKPTHVLASVTIQSAIDAAAPGDLIIVDPTCNPTTPPAAGTDPCTVPGSRTTSAHTELLLMWKPVRLQGVGAASSIINANTHPAGKLDPWRQEVDCLFGISISGQPTSATNPYDPTGAVSCPATGWNYFAPSANNPQVDRLPLEATLGWDASLNGNLAELLQEPSLMGALEGAGITVLAKGVFYPSNPFDSTLLAGFPTGTVLFTATNTGTYCNGTYPSNFWCNPSSIDGLGISNSSQGGGGIFVHGWGHNIQIANNRLTNNSGTLSGGINVGQGEFPPNYIQGSATNAPPGSCETSARTGQQLPYCHNLNVNVHNNNVSLNSATGDELFSATPAGAGGVSFCTGSDYYKFNYNWVCGNLSSGDGGGLGHLGFSKNGDIEHNSIMFNQSTNPTIAANGGGMIVMGTPDVDPPCGATTDADCVPPLGSVPPSDGVGPNLVINANLIMGNSAESGSGGGIAFQNVNGGDVLAFPMTPENWHHVTVTNNIIVDNVAGWDGAGVSLLDALNLDLINNTIVSNSTTANAGVLANTIGAPLASTQNGHVCSTNCGNTTPPQPAGLVSIQNSATLTANLNQLPAPGQVVCPAGHYAAGGNATDGTCRTASYPLLANNIFWQNSAYYIGVGALSPAFQQHVVTLYNAFTNTAAANQPATGTCAAGASYWDIGVRGDTGPGNHSSGVTLGPLYSILTSTTGYDPSNSANNPAVVSQYCNGSRVPPEACTATGGCGWQVPPGIADATVPNPIFNLTPVATVDEGNNWINMRWGPLSMVNPVSGAVLGNYSPTPTSQAVDQIGPLSPTYTMAPTTDFFGNPRPDLAHTQIDIGAVELVNSGSAAAAVAPPALSFPPQLVGTTSAPMTVTLSNAGELPLTINSIAISGANAGDFAQVNTCGATLASGASCPINVTFRPTAVGARFAQVVISTNDPGNPILTVGLLGTGAAPVAQVAPTSLTFANTNVGTTTAAQNVTLSNIGSAPLTIANIAVSDTTNYAQTSSCVLLLAPGASCTISVTFHPTTFGPKNANLIVTDNSNGVAGSTQNVALTGTGLAPALRLTPTSLTFNSPQFTPSAAQSVTVTNIGNAPLVINSITRTGANSNQFAANSTGGTACPIGGGGLAGGASCTVSVTFTPTSQGTKTASLNVNVAAPATSASVSLTGTVPVMSLTPGAHGFGNQAINTTSAPFVFTVQNTGTGPLVITSITTPTLFGGGGFASASNCPIGGVGLAAGASCTVNVTFTPTSNGGKIGALIVAGTSLFSSGASMLTGTGFTPVAVVGFSAPNPSLVTGTRTAHTGTITVTNSGTGPLTLTANPTVTETAGLNNFAIVAPTTGTRCVSGFVVAAGGTCTIGVQYTPNTSGTLTTSTAHVTLTDNGTAGGNGATQNSGNFNAN